MKLYGEISVPVSETNWLIKLKVKILIHLGVLAAHIVTVNMMNEGRTNEKARKLRYRECCGSQTQRGVSIVRL
jgi:hypothetical protein